MRIKLIEYQRSNLPQRSIMNYAYPYYMDYRILGIQSQISSVHDSDFRSKHPLIPHYQFPLTEWYDYRDTRIKDSDFSGYRELKDQCSFDILRKT